MNLLQNKKIIKGLKLATLIISYDLFISLFYLVFIKTLGFDFLEKVYMPFGIIKIFFYVPIFVLTSIIHVRNYLPWNLSYVIDYLLMFIFYFGVGYLLQTIKEKFDKKIYKK